ncbi:hypothetical protein RN001_006458 [Aquatica leii]|uniref:Acyl-CoA Delta(11) desaturase n=1 Tax=Aquatica leii TaxID=1421715 RepID=A0AAN7SJU8_9COLE|nr:hypothetical protein RN001_006458 [Aquatica leii]
MSEEQEKFNEEIEDPTREAHWGKIWFFTYLQMLTIYGFILIFNGAYLLTTLFSLCLICLGVIGVTAGAHRLWAHRSYEANTSLKVFLMLCQTLVGQGCIYDWVKYHRLHHKCFGTNQDPFNPSKGFFYSHFMCLTQKTTAEQEEIANNIDMSDLENDSVVMFQKKYYKILYMLLVIILPLYIPMAYWNETVVRAGTVAGWMRYGIILHFSWLIHSATTILGLKKGERYPLDTNLVFIINKTYWLQYHYLAPWDYQTSEYGNYGNDYISAFIRVCAALELATDLRTIDGHGVRDALYNSFETKKDISQCLSEVELSIPKDHYLRPQKFYYNY